MKFFWKAKEIKVGNIEDMLTISVLIFSREVYKFTNRGRCELIFIVHV